MLSIIINTKNSAHTLRACLESIKPLIHQTSGELIVVDMHSADDTREIAAEFGAKIFLHEDVGFADPARQFALDQAQYEWHFIIDSDETAPPDLIEQVREIVADEAPLHLQGDCFYIPRQNQLFNFYLQHTLWYPDFQLRLFRKNSLKWKPIAHSQPEILGTIKYFPDQKKYAFLHDNYRSIQDYWQRSDIYTSSQAKSIIANYKKAQNNSTQNVAEPINQVDLDFSGAAFFERFFSEFNRRFFAGAGHLDGNHGAMLSLLQAAVEVSALGKVWQAAKFPHQEMNTDEVMLVIKHWRQDLAYHGANLILQDEKLNPLQKLFWRFRRKFKI